MAPDIVNAAAARAAGPTKRASGPSRAYVTFLAGNGDYVKGVVGLAKGLRKVKSKYPLVVAILPDVPEEHRKILVDQGCIVREIEPLHPPENQTKFAMADYVINYSKLRIWEFVEYRKMVYLDGDIQVFDNIDHLFDNPDSYFYAVMDCFCEKTWSNTPQYKIGYCQQCPDRVQWASELGPKPPLYFNAGMFVFEPSLPTYHDLLDTVKVTPPTHFAEQFVQVFQGIGAINNTDYIQLSGNMATFKKVLKKADLNKFSVPQHWLGSLLPGNLVPDSKTPILVRDESSGHLFTFTLKVRKYDIDLNKEPQSHYEKPEFMAKGWTEFVKKKGLKDRHTICFMKYERHIGVLVDYTTKKNDEAA